MKHIAATVASETRAIIARQPLHIRVLFRLVRRRNIVHLPARLPGEKKDGNTWKAPLQNDTRTHA